MTGLTTHAGERLAGINGLDLGRLLPPDPAIHKL
jgi:hypothetical protein